MITGHDQLISFNEIIHIIPSKCQKVAKKDPFQVPRVQGLVFILFCPKLKDAQLALV